MSKVKKLTLADLNKLDKENDELETIYVANGKYSVEIRKKFRQTAIQRLLLDLQDSISTLRKEKVEVEDVKNVLLIFNMLIIKHFTTLPLQNLDLTKNEDLSKLIKVAEQLIDTGIFDEIMSAFDQDEVAKIRKAMDKANEIGKQLGEVFVQGVLNEQIQNEVIQNAEIQ